MKNKKEPLFKNGQELYQTVSKQNYKILSDRHFIQKGRVRYLGYFIKNLNSKKEYCISEYRLLSRNYILKEQMLKFKNRLFRVIE